MNLKFKKRKKKTKTFGIACGFDKIRFEHIDTTMWDTF